MKPRHLVTFSLGADVADLPTEFRIFRKGENASTKGPVWFDDRAAARVMAQIRAHGVDHMIDLEHYSIIPRRSDAHSTDCDARGWYRPDLRGGDLWATGVTWTEDGAARLRGRRQRYPSPAFLTEWDKTLNGGRGGKRVIELLNVGLVAMPATHQIEALVASRLSALDRTSGVGYRAPDMTEREAIEAALKALESGDTEAALAALKSAAPAEPAEEKPEANSEQAPPAPAEPAAEDRPTDEEPAVYSALRSISGADVAAAVELFRRLKSERDVADATELRSLVTALIELGAETPATAWSKGAPAARLASEGLADLRARVGALRAARPASTEVTPPTQPAPDADLTEGERATAATLAPEARARFIEIRRSRHAR